MERADKEAKSKAARDWVGQAKEAGLEARFTLHESGGRFVDAVASMAKEERADLIAIGSRYSIDPLGFVATNPRSLAREAPFPVLVIPMKERT
jgi:nucleotide-binding universal stress UspA family protein